MITKKKPLIFTKPTAGLTPVKDIENAADAKMPGDKKEDAADMKKKPVKKGKGAAFFANKAATALVKK